MEVSVEPLPKSTVKLTVAVTPQEMGRYYEQAAARVAGQVKVPGFREGKAPRAVIEKQVGAPALAHEARDLALTDSYYRAVMDNKLQPIGRPQTELPDGHDDLEKSGLRYTATVPVLPEVKLGDYRKVKVAPTESAFKPQQVGETLDQLRKGRAGFKAVERAAATGDRVEIDFVGTLKGTEVPGAKSENHPLVIGEDSFVPGFADKLVGLQTGQVKKFKITFPKDYHEATLAGQPVEFTVTMRKVEEVTVPDLDDEFAKSFGAKDAADLRRRLQENLEQEKAKEATQQTESKVVDAVVNGAETEAPDILIDEELDRMLAETRQHIESQGIQFDKYLEHLKKTEGELRTEQRPEAERRVKTSLVLNAIQQAENIAPTDAQVQAEIDDQLRQVDDEKAKQQVKGDEFRAYVRRILGNRLVVRRLVEQATGDPTGQSEHGSA